MTQDLKKDFIKEVTAAAKVRRAAEVYADMVRAMALSIEGAVTLGARCDEIEKEYAAIKERYTAAPSAPQQMELFAKEAV